jgi:hypothetical protein
VRSAAALVRGVELRLAVLQGAAQDEQVGDETSRAEIR